MIFLLGNNKLKQPSKSENTPKQQQAITTFQNNFGFQSLPKCKFINS